MFIDESVDRDSQQKLYVQVYSIIKGRIEKGDWPTGAQIPTEDELCKTYEVSKATVRIAISELVRSGLLKRWQGKGTFVANPAPSYGMAMKTRLTEDMFGEGVNASKEMVFRGVRRPSEEILAVLDVSEDVYCILCKRVVEDEPAYLEESYVPMALFPGIEGQDICNCSFYDLIQNQAVKKVSKVIQNIEVADINGEQAQLLMLSEGTPVLLLHRLLMGADGSPVAYTRLYGSGRKYRIQTEFERLR
jgi:DNA-binding GntR family transcriptional regulator